MKKLYSLMLLCAAIIFVTGCSKDDDNNSTPTPVSVSGVTLDKTTLTIEMGQTATLIATVSPENTADKSVTWSNDKTDIATVKDGVVTAVAVGTATITVTSVADATKKATCTVTVEASKFIEVNGVKVAVGNLVADGDHGAKIGTATDGGLYFQFGSLIGWSTEDPLTVAVSPAGYTSTTWNTSWAGDPATDDAVSGKGDPCRYYLGEPWRLPTKEEYAALFNNVTDGKYANSGGWSWDATANSAANSTKNLTFPASGSRDSNGGSLRYVGTYGYCWSASPYGASSGFGLSFGGSGVFPSGSGSQASGFPVRCVN